MSTTKEADLNDSKTLAKLSVSCSFDNITVPRQKKMVYIKLFPHQNIFRALQKSTFGNQAYRTSKTHDHGLNFKASIGKKTQHNA